MSKNSDKIATKLVGLGRDKKRDHGSVHPPVHRTSTILFDDYAQFIAYERGQIPHRSYARYGTINHEALAESIAQLEGADHGFVFSSGLAAITTAMFAFANAGDHVLIVDSVYSSTRKFTDYELPRFGVEVEYYDPTISGEEIAKRIKPNTKFVYCESPGSLTFEMQDIPAIAKAAHDAGALVLADNTWATVLHQDPFALGIDISIHSATKYIAGHSDLVVGAVTCKEKHFKQLNRTHRNIGACASADVCYLALRGMRTMAVRMKQHQESAMKVAAWLEGRAEVKRVLFPALPSHPQHDLYKRDLTGCASVFGIEVGKQSDEALAAMIDGLEHFGLGFSWGGFESLILSCEPAGYRVTGDFEKGSTVLRLSIGLEDVDDLIADLDAGFARMKAAS